MAKHLKLFPGTYLTNTKRMVVSMAKEIFSALANVNRSDTVWTVRRGEGCPPPVLNEFVRKLDGVSSGNGVRVIKSNKARTTLSVPFVNGRRVIVKRYHLRGWREKVKYLFVPARAGVEWRMINALLARGVPAAVPLAYGERRRWGVLLDESLIIEEIPHCLTFQSYIKRHCSGTPSRDKVLLKRTLLRKLADLIRHVHEKCIDHRDFHGGNILVTETGPGDPVLHVIDLHKARVCKGLSLRRRIDDLALQCDIPGFTFSRTDCLRFVRRYADFHDKKTFKGFASNVFKRTELLRKKRLRSTTRWCLKLSNVFAVYKAKGVRVYYRKEYKIDDIISLLKRVSECRENTRRHVLKRSSKSVSFLEELPLMGGRRKVVVKHNACRGLFDMLKKTFLGTRSRRAWVAANGLIVRGLPTPRPVALVEKDSFGLRRDNFLLTEYVDGLLSVNDYVSGRFSSNVVNTEKRRFIEGLAGLYRAFHDTGVYHGDLSGRNILVREGQGEGWEMFIADLDAVSSWRRLTLKRRLKNLSQINDCPDCISRADRMRFFKTYYRGLPPGAHKYAGRIVKLTEARRLRRRLGASRKKAG